MKTKFIKGTDKKYSIREDGVVFSNYYFNRNGDKVKRKNPLKSRKDKDRIIVQINYGEAKGPKCTKALVKEYFGFFYCKKCSKKTKDNNNIQYFFCKKCTKEKRRLNSAKFKSNNPEKIKLSRDKYRKDLKDGYISTVLRCATQNLTPEIIDAKKNHLKLYREIKKQKTK
jgi:hypothetical protein